MQCKSTDPTKSGINAQKDVLTFVRRETVAVWNFGSDIVLQSFKMVLELFG
jgi:hypothetical protein